ncbi:MAG: TonB-dependent receptor [Proteobacteria bacterium]|nr:TonB-dependent receptor [Pseudomonadota bacterium]
MAAIAWATAIALNTPAAMAADPGNSNAASGQLADVVVTAEKRTQDIKDVPLSISVLSGDSLQADHVVTYEDMTRTVPGVSFLSGGGPGLDNISMRGVSSTSGAATVGLYLDEVSVSAKNLWNGAIEPKLFDVTRVEVLRGPQGTLYGSSSMGGTIRMISNRPNVNQFEGMASADVSKTSHGGVNDEVIGVVNLPLKDGVSALRLGVDYTKNSGYIDNYSPSGALARSGVNDDRTVAARASLLVKAGEAVTILPAVYYMRMTVDDTSVFYPSMGLYQQNKIVPEPSTITLTVPSLTIDADLGWSDLTSVTSYFRQQFDRTGDATYYNSEYLGYLIDTDPVLGTKQVGYLFGQLPGPEYSWTNTTQFSQELRIASKASASPLSWLAGLYFSQQKVDREVDDYVFGFDSLFNQQFGYPPEQSGLFSGQSFPGDSVALAHLETTDTQYAAFGELGYKFAPGLKATVGLRYSRAKAEFAEQGSGYFIGPTPLNFGTSADFNAATPRFAVTYDVNDSASLYAAVAKGFRLGGTQIPVPDAICGADLAVLGLQKAPLTYDSDSLWSYEVGAKGRALDNRLSFSAAAYYIRWNNIQQTINLPSCGYTLTTNVGDAKSYGSEVEVTARPTSQWTFGAAGGTTHATLTRVISQVGAEVGDHILNTPSWTATLHSEYVVRFGTSDFFLRGAYAWTGPSFGSFSTIDPDHERPSYGSLQASLGVDVGSLQVSLYGTNLLNESKTIQRPSLLFLEEAYTLRPRTIGLMASMRF